MVVVPDFYVRYTESNNARMVDMQKIPRRKSLRRLV
jgi:hypothetical protein